MWFREAHHKKRIKDDCQHSEKNTPTPQTKLNKIKDQNTQKVKKEYKKERSLIEQCKTVRMKFFFFFFLGSPLFQAKNGHTDSYCTRKQWE